MKTRFYYFDIDSCPIGLEFEGTGQQAANECRQYLKNIFGTVYTPFYILGFSIGNTFFSCNLKTNL